MTQGQRFLTRDFQTLSIYIRRGRREGVVQPLTPAHQDLVIHVRGINLKLLPDVHHERDGN